MKRYQNLLLLALAAMLVALPLWLVETPVADDGRPAEIFAGADDQAKDAIGVIAPGYQPWFQPVLEPASGEIASLLFALQAALGAGFIGYYLGLSVGRENEKCKKEKHQKEGREAAGEGKAADAD